MEALRDSTISLDDFVGEQCILAFDIGSKIDMTAKALLFKREGIYYLFSEHYLPEETAELEENTHYQGWAKEGWLRTTLGNVIDYDQLQDDIAHDRERFDVLEIPYDPWNATQMALNLMKGGAKCVQYNNTVRNMSEPMKELQACVYNRTLLHNDNPVLNWEVSNVVSRRDHKGNEFPTKENDDNKIDAVVAAIMAMGRWVCME